MQFLEAFPLDSSPAINIIPGPLPVSISWCLLFLRATGPPSVSEPAPAYHSPAGMPNFCRNTPEILAFALVNIQDQTNCTVLSFRCLIAPRSIDLFPPFVYRLLCLFKQESEQSKEPLTYIPKGNLGKFTHTSTEKCVDFGLGKKLKLCCPLLP